MNQPSISRVELLNLIAHLNRDIYNAHRQWEERIGGPDKERLPTGFTKDYIDNLIKLLAAAQSELG